MPTRTKQRKAFQIPYIAALVPPLCDATSDMANKHERQCGEHLAHRELCCENWHTSSVEQHVNKGTDFLLKTYYAKRLYHRVKEAFHTEFPNSATTLSDFSILQLVRKFDEAGSIQDKLRKGRLHIVTTTECVEEVHKLIAQNPYTSTRSLAAQVKTSFVRFSKFHLHDLCLTLYIDINFCLIFRTLHFAFCSISHQDRHSQTSYTLIVFRIL